MSHFWFRLALVLLLAPSGWLWPVAARSQGLPLHQLNFLDRGITGPVRVQGVVIDLQNPRVHLKLGLARGKAADRALVSHIARRLHGVAAINGSFFQGTRVQSAVGLLMRNGELISDSGHRRTSLGLLRDGRVVMGIPAITTGLSYPDTGRFVRVNGVNQPRLNHQTIVYTPRFGAYTRTNRWGREVVVSGGRVVRYSYGNTRIPPQGFVISAHGKGAEIQRLYPLGQRIDLRTQALAPWDQAETILTGAPQLVHHGRIYNTFFQENLSPSLMAPNARSAIGYTHNHKLLLVTIKPQGHSRGVTLTRLAQIMRRLGALEAMALDGGGSTSLYLASRPANAQRRVSNALVVTLAP